MSYASVASIKHEIPSKMVNPVPPGWIRLFKHPVNGRVCARYGDEIKTISPKSRNTILERFIAEDKQTNEMNLRYGEDSPCWNKRIYLDSETESESESESEEEEEYIDDFDDEMDEY